MDKVRTVILSTPEELFPLIAEAIRSAGQEKSSNESRAQDKKLLTPRDIEQEYGIHRKMLAYWRMESIGPSYITFGRRIFYERKVFEEFVASGKIETTGYVDS